ncbi:MAG: PQQ-binding-like beta-propeller repeat protein [Pirellula sp.]
MKTLRQTTLRQTTLRQIAQKFYQAARPLGWSLGLLGLLSATCSADDWRQFRGGDALSINAQSHLPADWKEPPSAAWRTPIEGSGWSQPIIVGDKVFVSSAVSAKGGKPKGMTGGVMDPSTMGRAAKPKDPVTWKLFCLSFSNGQILWEQTVIEAIPAFGKHASNTFATETPAASNDAVFVYFGAAGYMAAYDFDGKQKWSKSLEPQKINNDFGTGTSLLLIEKDDAVGKRLILQQYNEQSATLFCLSPTDGQELWRAERPKGSAWSTPIHWSNQGTDEIVTGGQGSVIAYDLSSGNERWRVGGLDTSFSCSLVADESAVYFGTASPGSRAPIYAVAKGHQGDLSLSKDATSSEAVLWSGFKSGAGMPSPVVVGDYLYFFGNTATCYEKKTGKEVYRKRMPGGTLVAGCPVVVGDRIYMFNEAGNMIIVKTGPEFEATELATGSKDEVYWSTPAVSANSILVRSSDAVYCYR